MDDIVQRGLSRLRGPDGAARRALAELLVDEHLAAPIAAIVSPRFLAVQLATSLQALSRLDWTVVPRADDSRALRDLAPDLDAVRAALARPYTPDADLVHRIVDQPAIRGLVRLVLTDTVNRFQRRAVEVDAGLLGGLGARAAARGRGLFDSVSKNLGGLVEVVRGEVDHALEARINEFVGAATAEAVRTIASYLADPQHGDQVGQMRVAILDAVLDTPVAVLASEIDRGGLDVVREGVRAWVGHPDFVPRAETWIGEALETVGGGSLGGWLDEVGLRAAWTATTTEWLAERLRAVADSAGFEAWWLELFAEPR